MLSDDKLASASLDGTARVWKDDTCLHTLMAGPVHTLQRLVALPDSKMAVASHNHMVHVWDTVSGRCLLTLAGHTAAVNAMIALPCGKLATGSDDKTVRVWDIVNGSCQTLFGHNAYVRDLAALPGSKLVSASDDEKMHVWDMKSGECVSTIQDHTYSRVDMLRNGARLLTLKGHTSYVNALAVLPGCGLASCSYNHTVRVWR